MTISGMSAPRLAEFISAWNAHDVDRIVGHLAVVVAGDRGHATWTCSGHDASGTLVSYRGADVFEVSGDLIRLKDAFRKERSRPLG